MAETMVKAAPRLGDSGRWLPFRSLVAPPQGTGFSASPQSDAVGSMPPRVTAASEVLSRQSLSDKVLMSSSGPSASTNRSLIERAQVRLSSIREVPHSQRYP